MVITSITELKWQSVTQLSESSTGLEYDLPGLIHAIGICGVDVVQIALTYTAVSAAVATKKIKPTLYHRVIE